MKKILPVQSHKGAAPINIPKSQPVGRVMFLNQSAGKLFLELVEDVADQIGSVCLVTGTQVKLDSQNVVLRKCASYARRNLFTRLWSWLLFSGAAMKQIWSVKPDVLLLVVSNPPLLPWLAWLAHFLRKQPYIVLVYDIYPDILVGLKKLRPNSLLADIWRHINRKVLGRATKVVTLGKHMAQTLEQYLPKETMVTRLNIIATWVDTNHFVPLNKDRNDFALQYGQKNKFTVLYSGNIGFSHDVGILVDAAQKLRDAPVFSFLIIGDGQGKAGLMERVSTAGLSNIIFLPFQNEQTLPFSLATADVAAVSIGSGAQGLMMPSKTYYAMAVGSAILGLSYPPNDLADIIEDYQCGVNIAPDDLDGLVDTLKRFKTDSEYLRRCQRNARRAAEAHFSRDGNTKLFAQLIKSCCAKTTI